MASEHQSSDGKPQIRLRRPTAARLRKTAEFRRCYDSGNRAGDNHLLLFAATSDQRHTRVGVSVSKKHGNAVRRNRKKRLLREASRLGRHDLPALDIVLVPRQNDRSTLQDYQMSLISLAAKLAKRINRNQQVDR